MTSKCLTYSLIIFTASFFPIQGAFGATYSWVGPTGNWNDSSKWSPSTGFPGAGDTATIDGGTVTLSADATAAIVNFASGILAGDSNLSITQTLNWEAGFRMDSTQTVTIDTGATATLSGSGDHKIHFGKLLINGNFNHEGPGRLILDYGATLEIGPTGVVDIQGDFTWQHVWGEAATLTINGTIKKSVGSGQSLINNLIPTSAPTARFEAQTGTLTFQNGINGGGTFHAETGALILIQTTSTLSNVSLTGPGIKRFAGGTLLLSGTCPGENVELAGANLTGSHTLQGSWKWLAGGLNDEGTTTIDTGATFTLSGAGDHKIHTRTFLVKGTFDHDGPGNLVLDYGAILEIGPNGLANINGEQSWIHVWGNLPSVINNGTLTKSSTGTGLLQNMTVTNNGLVEVIGGSLTTHITTYNNAGLTRLDTGILTHSGGGISSGNWHTGAGTVVVFTAGSPTIQSGATFTGDGDWKIAGATVNFAGTINISRLELASGTLDGEGTLSITDTFRWSGTSLMAGTGTMTINKDSLLIISGGSDHKIHTRTLLNNGTLNHEGPGNLILDYAANLEIGATGIADIQGDLKWAHVWGNPATLINKGTIRKSTTAGSAILQNLKPINSASGSIEVEDGSLILPKGVSGSGTLHAANGTELLIQQSSSLTDVTLSGPGSKRFTAGTLLLSGTCPGENVELAGANLNGTHTLQGSWKWLSGGLYDEGTTTIDTGATFTLSGAGDHKIHTRTFLIDGTFNHEGPGNLILDYGAILEISPNGLADIKGEQTWKHVWGNMPSVVNNGTVLKSSSGTALMQNLVVNNNSLLDVSEGSLTLSNSAFSNTGEARITDGILTLGGNGTSNGEFSATTGSKIIFSSGSPTFESGATFTGDGEWEFAGATVNIAGDVIIPKLELSSGTVTGGGDLTVSKNFLWSGASLMDGTGSTIIPPGATAVANADGDQKIHYRTFLIDGTFRHDGPGAFVLDYAANCEIGTNGVAYMNGDVTWKHVWGNPATLTNNGKIIKSLGAGNAAFVNITPTNSPTSRIEVRSGSLLLQNGINGGGEFQANAGAQIVFQKNANLLDATFSGKGIQRFTGGTVTLNGDCYAANMEFAGATIVGTHALSGTWHWSTGQFNGPGSTTINSDGLLRMIGTSDHTINNRDLTNYGVVDHVGSGRLVLNYGSRFENTVAGTIVLESDSLWFDQWGAGSSFINKGIIYKAEGSNTSFQFDDFQNTGLIIAEANWIYDEAHSWVFVTDVYQDGYLFHNYPPRAWAWMPFQHSSYIFWYDPINSWTYHAPGTPPGDRWFFHFGLETWVHEDALKP